MYDVIIVGGGPAGSAAAITLAKAGKKVLILEKGEKNREKPCGDGLMPDAQHMLEKLGVLAEVRKNAKEIISAQFFPPKGKPVEVPLSFLTLSRSRLDQILRDEAEKSGVTVTHGVEIKDIQENEDEIRIGNYSAPYAIIATGANISLAQKLGIPTEPLATGAAIRGYQRIKAKQNQITVFFIEDIMPGYAWIFPLSETEANIGVGYAFDRAPAEKDLRKLLHQFVISPQAKEILEGDPYNVVAAPLRAGLHFKSTGTDRILLCGENIDTTLHVIGEGVGKALATGIMAAESTLTSNAQENYRKKLASLRSIHDGYTTLHQACGKPFIKRTLQSALLTNIGVSFLNTSKGKRFITQIYNEEKSPMELTSRWKILKNVLFFQKA